MLLDHPTDGPAAIRTQFGAIFASLELSRSNWLVTSLSPGKGEKMSRHTISAGDVAELLKLFAELKRKAQARTGESYPIITIQEAGLDGFWLHRVLQREGIESHVVDPASIATSRRRRRAKTDKIDGETLLRTLLAYKRGEPRVCAMVVAPSPEEEDRRRLCRERKTLIAERIEHVNRIKGLLFAQGIFDYAPLQRHRKVRLEALRTGDGRPLPRHLRAQIDRELDRLEMLIGHIEAVEAEQEALLAASKGIDNTAHPVAMLLALKGIGPNFTTDLWTEAFYRQFANRRKIAAYAGLAATPWRSGGIAREQGVSNSAPENHDDPARLVVGTPPAPIGADPVVQGQQRPRPQANDCGAGAQAAGGPVEVRDRWRRDRGSRDEGRLRISSLTKDTHRRG